MTTWRKVDPYHLESDCGRYTVARTNHGGVPTYVAWRKPAVRLLMVNTESDDESRLAAINECKAACLEDMQCPRQPK